MVAGGGETAPLLGNESPAQLKQIKHDAMLGAVFALGYMIISIGLTLYNKWVMPDFKFPFCYFMLQQARLGAQSLWLHIIMCAPIHDCRSLFADRRPLEPRASRLPFFPARSRPGSWRQRPPSSGGRPLDSACC